MAVFLSPVGGAAGQFFDNNGIPLAGGKLYTYAAGTTTNQTTYINFVGVTAHTNPIILDSAGRVPGGEVWLTTSEYKFVVKTSNDVLIATYDNIYGINLVPEASNIPFTGFKGQVGTVESLAGNDGSDWIGFTQQNSSSVSISAQDKLKQWLSVKDFGATGDGVTNDTAAIQLAFNAANGTKSVIFPDGSYKITVSIDCKGSSFSGQSMYQSIILCQLANARAFTNTGRNISDLAFVGTGFPTADAFEINGYLNNINNCYFNELRDAICPTSIIVTTTVNQCLVLGCNSAINDKLHDGTSAHTTLWFTSNSVQYSTNAFVMKTEAAGFYVAGNVFEQLERCYWAINGNQLFSSTFIGNWFEQVYTNLTIFVNLFAGSNFTCVENALRPGPMVITDIDKMGASQFTLVGDASGGGGGARVTTGSIRLCDFQGETGQLLSYGGVKPASATANNTVATNYTLETQAANANQTSIGGDFIVKTGAGSNGQRKGVFRPFADNDTQIGDASFRWSVIYAGTGTINTSDENQKEQIVDLSDAEKATALAIKSQIKRFKFKDAVREKSDNARYHFGVIAQQVEQTFKDNGLNPEDYGVFCRDVWYTEIDKETQEVKKVFPDLNGQIPNNAITNIRYGIRYDELFAFIIAAI